MFSTHHNTCTVISGMKLDQRVLLKVCPSIHAVVCDYATKGNTEQKVQLTNEGTIYCFCITSAALLNQHMHL